MKFLALVCGADDDWVVPTLTPDPHVMLGPLTEPAADDHGATMVTADVTHMLILTRPSTAPQMRRLATLVQAYDSRRYVAVLETPQTPLAMSLVAERVNAESTEPGSGVEHVLHLLSVTDSGWWVRRAGAVSEARPSLWQIVRSWFSKTGFIASDAMPVALRLAEEPAWADVVDGVSRFVTAGEVPAVQRDHIEAHRDGEDIYARGVSRSGKAIVGQKRAFEWAALRWAADTAPAARPGARPCESCTAMVETTCPFCHAQWGALPGPGAARTELTSKEVLA